MIQLSRRRFLIGSASLLAAPAIVRASEIMPVKALPEELFWDRYATFTRYSGFDPFHFSPDDVLRATAHDLHYGANLVERA